MIVGGILLALAVGALMSAMAIKTGSSEAVQGAFPLLFILLFFSSTFFPRQTMSGVYRTIADINPMSYLVRRLSDRSRSNRSTRPPWPRRSSFRSR